MRSFFQKKQHKDENSIIFILESGSISTATIENKNGLPPHFFSNSENPLAYQHEVDPQKMMEIMISGLKSNAENLSKQSPLLASSVEIFFGSPWYISAINTTVISKDKPFLIKENMIEESTEKAFSADASTFVVEHNILSVKANGYEIENPVGKKAKTIEIRSFANSVSKNLIEKVEDAIFSSFPNSGFKIKFHTVTQALFPVVKELTAKKDLLLFVPEYETSEILLIRNGIIDASVSMPFGKNTPLRAIADKLEKDNQNAESILHLFLLNELEESTRGRVNEIMETTKEKFLESLQNALWKISTTSFLPRDVIVSDADNISRLLGEWISKDTWLSGSQGAINVGFLDKNIAESKILKEKNVSDLNTSLIAASFYLRSI